MDEEIKAQTYTLSRQKEQFEKSHNEQIRILEKRQKDIDETAALYSRLVSETNENNQLLKNQLQKIAEERLLHNSEMTRLNKHVQEIESEGGKREADISEREEALKKEIEAFELQKEELEPTLNRISEVKNENVVLLRKIDDERTKFDHQKALFDNYKQKLEDDVLAAKNVVKKREESLAIEEARIRKWEKDLQDIDLELKGREALAQKMMVKYQINRDLDKQ